MKLAKLSLVVSAFALGDLPETQHRLEHASLFCDWSPAR